MKNLISVINKKSKQGDRGYTIIELLVIVIMLGVLSAIAAPGWLGFINRQRVRTVNDRVFQSLRTAQSEAKRNKRDIAITFDTSFDPPKITIDTNPPGTNPLVQETLNGGGEIKPGTIALVSNAPSLTFNYQGNVNELPVDPSSTNGPRFKATVSPAGGGAKQCVFVETIIGGMRTGEGKECN
jgi:type II secretory pathway pseudopilin PulG